MSDEMRGINEYPDISFIDNYTLKKLEEDMIGWFMDKRREITKETITLATADDRRILLQTGAYYIFMALMYLDHAGKQNLLKYSSGPYLDHLGMAKRVEKGEARKATVTLRYSILAAREAATGIPAGSRASAGDGIYFATMEYAEIAIGDLYVDVRAICSVAGSNGNLYGIGEIKQMTDTIPFIDQVVNITAPENGSDEQSEESFREAIYMAPESYSAAGAEGAYLYFAKKHSDLIIDVKATSPSPRVVEIRCLLAGGEIPGDEFISSLEEYLSDPDIKMLTDVIKVVKPGTYEYEISATYWINESDKSQANIIQEKVNQAVDDYILWQRSKIGRDINHSELTKRIMTAGAKRVRVNKPEYTVIDSCSVAICTKKTMVYGGLEDD